MTETDVIDRAREMKSVFRTEGWKLIKEYLEIYLMDAKMRSDISKCNPSELDDKKMREVVFYAGKIKGLELVMRMEKDIDEEINKKK